MISCQQKNLNYVTRVFSYGPGHVSIGIVKYFSGNGISDGYHKYEIG